MTLTYEDWNIEEMTGYHPITTFYMDFSIADKFGKAAILDTYKRAKEALCGSPKGNFKEITELVMALNWKCWRWYEHNDEYSMLYSTLYHELDAWCCGNLRGEQLSYYLSTTD